MVASLPKNNFPLVDDALLNQVRNLFVCMKTLIGERHHQATRVSHCHFFHGFGKQMKKDQQALKWTFWKGVSSGKEIIENLTALLQVALHQSDCQFVLFGIVIEKPLLVITAVLTISSIPVSTNPFSKIRLSAAPSIRSWVAFDRVDRVTWLIPGNTTLGVVWASLFFTSYWLSC